MSQEIPQEQPHPPLKTDVYRKDLIACVREGGYSREEYFRAHELALGVPETETETKGEVSEHVQDLVKKIKRLFDEGMPVTVSAEIADTLTELESAPAHLHELIASLHLSEREKGTLTSIFNNKRTGELAVYKQGNDTPVFTATITPKVWEDERAQWYLTYELGAALYRLKDMQLELTWSE